MCELAITIEPDYTTDIGEVTFFGAVSESFRLMGNDMVNSDIMAIKDNILSTIGDECEKIILFGSYAYGTPNKDSDYDFYVVLKDGVENPILLLQKIYEYMCDTNYTPVDILANHKSRFEWRSTQPTLERTIAKRGMVLYERT